MCFSPKIKTPKVDTNKMKAVDPAPLTEEPKGILFGGEEETDSGTSSEVATGSSRKDSQVDLKVDKPSESKKTKGGVKKSISTKAFGK